MNKENFKSNEYDVWVLAVVIINTFIVFAIILALLYKENVETKHLVNLSMWSVSVLLGLIVLATSRVEIAADGIRRVWYFLFIKRARFLSHESIISIEVKGNRVTIRRYGQLVPLPDIFYIKDRKSFIAAIEKHIPDKLEVKS